MNLTTIKNSLEANKIYLSDEQVLERPTIVGYEKKFRWAWIATQLNTFIVATDFGEEEITVDLIEKHLSTGFALAKKNYTGWPRGLQSGMGVISILISTNIDAAAQEYCLKLKSGKKWAGFTIPVAVDSSSNTVYSFEKKPMWGRIYYPHFRKLIDGLA